MTAAPSQTGIANAALVLLGTSARIGAINEGSPLSRQFFDIWDATRDEVQAAHPWNPCIGRRNGARDAGFTAIGSQWAYRFERPAGMLRWLPWERDHEDWFDGEEEEGFILANDTAIVIRGIFRVEDMARWTPGMIEAMAAKLAAKTAKAITGQSGMMNRLDGVFADVIARARREDGLATGQRNRRAVFRSSWLEARQ
jgi:hypothetical protein